MRKKVGRIPRRNPRLKNAGFQQAARFNSPSLIAVEPRGKHAVQVCAGADEEQHDEQEGLEFQDAEHCRCRGVLCENTVGAFRRGGFRSGVDSFILSVDREL